MTRRRCVIYTRKSTEEGLEQGFNSLQAQREACEAYIKSQAHEGWRLIPRHFDDGGYSGGSMERPALQRLLADINAGLVDTIVVYKVDRLTRSLADFAKMVETFDAKGVSFVSVTQQFNTTTSMGRLTLNVLLSFAQFEREVTAERIRDKIAASKQKGMWMGGTVPLGYEAKNRELVIVQDEARTIRQLFELYLKLGTVMKVKVEAERLGLATKRRTDAAAKITGGGPFSRGHLHWILSNPIYAGRIAHKGVVHPGRHPAIIDPKTFDDVQHRLADNATKRRSEKNAAEPSLLAGLVFDETGDRLCPTHTSKKGRRYRYYISKRLMHKSENPTLDAWRLPAKELETLVLQALAKLLADRNKVIDVFQLSDLAPGPLQSALRHAKAAADMFEEGSAGNPADLVVAFVMRVVISESLIRIEVRRSGLQGIAQEESGAEVSSAANYNLTLPVRLKRRGAGAKLVILADTGSQRPADQKLLCLIADALRWVEDLAQGRAVSLRKLAARSYTDVSQVSRTLPLAFLAPDLIKAIVDGRHPIGLARQHLRRAKVLPHRWNDQYRNFRFAG